MPIHNGVHVSRRQLAILHLNGAPLEDRSLADLEEAADAVGVEVEGRRTKKNLAAAIEGAATTPIGDTIQRGGE